MPVTTINQTINNLIPSWKGVECVPDILVAEEDAPILIDSVETRIPYNCVGEQDDKVIILRGVVECNIVDNVYTVSYGSVLTKVPIPVVTLVIPTINDVIFNYSILEVSASNFKILLSGIPPVLGYKLNWSIS